MAKSVTSVSFFVTKLVLFGVCLTSLEAYEFGPVTIPVAELPVLFPDSHLAFESQEPIQAPSLEGDSDSDPSLVHVVHKEFNLEPIYKDILSEKLIDPSSFLEIKSSEGVVDREPRKVDSGIGNVIKSLLRIPTPSQVTKRKSNDNNKRKSDNSEKVRQSNEDYTSDEDNTDDEENTSSYESSEEIKSDSRKSVHSNDKSGNTKKKNLQSNFFRSTDEGPDEPDDDENESGEEDEEIKKPSLDPKKIDIELLHSLSEQFILENGELRELNSSDFSVVNNNEKNQKEKEKIQDHSNKEESDSEESEIVPSYEKKLKHNSRNRESVDEEIEGGYSPSKNREGQNSREQITQDEQNSKEYRSIVKTLIEQKLAEIQEEQEREDKLSEIQEEQERVAKQTMQTFRNVLQQSNSNYNIRNQEEPKPRYSNPIAPRQLLQNVNTNSKESYNENHANLNNIPQPTRNSYLQIQSRNNANTNDNRGSYAPPPAINSRLQNSILNLNLQRQQQNVMRQKLSLVRQLQMYNRQTSFSNSTLQSRKFSQPSPYSPVNNYEQRHNDPTNPIPEADKLNVFLFGSPRFTTLNSLSSPKPTRQSAENTYYDSPASYTRRPPLKLQQPIQKQPQKGSHYDRTKHSSEEVDIVTKASKSTSLEDCNNDSQWIPITSRPSIFSSPEKLRNSNSVTKFSTNSGYSSPNNKDRSSAERISSSERNAQHSRYNNNHHPGSIQDILGNQKYSSGEKEKPNTSVESRKPGTNSAPVLHLIDDLTGVIEKHKTLAASAEEISGSQSIKQANSHKFLYSTIAPPTPAEKTTTPNKNLQQQQPTQYTNINVNQFHHYDSNPQHPFIASNLSTLANTASSSFMEFPIDNSSLSFSTSSPPGTNPELHYYADDIRAQLNFQKHLLAVKPYVPPNAQTRPTHRNPIHSFVNSLHALAEKNRNRHSHVQELLHSFLSPKSKTPDPEKQKNLGGNHPSAYDAVPFYTLDPIPQGQDSTNAGRVRPIPYLASFRPYNPESEILPGSHISPIPQPIAKLQKPYPFIPRRPEYDDDVEDSNSRKPKEYLGDTKARLIHRVHDIFKQFIPPVLHIGGSSSSSEK